MQKDELRLQLEAACSAFLNAATHTERAAAEIILMAFRKMSQPLPMCCYVLQFSPMPYAQLQALYTLRENLGREWLAQPKAEREGLQLLLLKLLASGQALESYVSAAITQLLAVHAKHALLNDTHEGSATAATLLRGVEGLLMEQPSNAHASMAARLLGTLVTEFGAPTGGLSSGGLSWVSHARARLVFQQQHLLSVFQLGLKQLELLVAASATSPSHNGGLQECAVLLTTVLSWDFDGLAEAASVHGVGEGESRPGLDATTVRPPADQPSWRQLLGQPQLIGWVMQLHTGHVEEQTKHALRQLLVQLASLSRRVFEGDDAHAKSVQVLLGAASNFIREHRPDASMETRALEFLDGASILQRIVCSGSTEALVVLPPLLFQALLELLHCATLGALNASLVTQPNDEGLEQASQAEAYDILMEAWVSLLAGSRAVRARGRLPAEAGAGLMAEAGAFLMLDRAAWMVYEASLQARLTGAAVLAKLLAAEVVADGGEEDSVDEERYGALAVLGRSSPASAVKLLCSCLGERTQRLQQYCEHALTAKTGQTAAPKVSGEAQALEALLEELDLLVNCAGHLLADASEGGDAAEPPPEVAAASSGGGPEPEAHPVALLVEAVHRLLQLQLQALAASVQPTGVLSNALSPLLGVSLLSFLRRISCSYLMPDEASCSVLSPPLLALWGRDTPGAASLLSTSVEAAAAYLERWPSEPDLAFEACLLIVGLSRLRAPRPGPAALLASLPVWGRLVVLPSSAVQPAAERLLREALCRGAASIADDSERLCALRATCAPPTQRLHALLSSAPSSAPHRTRLCQPDAMLEVRGVCACLRGLASATTQASAPIIFEAVGICLPALTGMLEPYSPAAEPLLHILKVFRDMAAAQAALLPDEQAQNLAGQVSALVSAYVQYVPPEAHTEGTAVAQAICSTSLISEGDRYEQTLTLLQVVTHLAARSETGGENLSIDGYTTALLGALQHVIPRISLPLLQYPLLCEQYFDFLSNLLENRPISTSLLPAPLHDAMLASIQFGLGHHQTSICRKALESAYELARQANQHSGLAATMATMLQTLLTRILGDLLCSRLHPDLVDPAAGNALLALIVTQQQHWQEWHLPAIPDVHIGAGVLLACAA